MLLALVALDETEPGFNRCGRRRRRSGRVQLRGREGRSLLHHTPNCSTACCWCRATARPTSWRTYWVGWAQPVAKMDAKAASLGAVNTHASTPSGLDGPGGSGWSSAHDLAVIFRPAMTNPVFAQITAEPSAIFQGRCSQAADRQPRRVAGALPGRDRR